MDKYRNPASLEEAERYPNVDWQDYLFKDYAMAYNGNISISGGTKFVRYFAVIAVSYTHLDVYKRQLVSAAGKHMWFDACELLEIPPVMAFGRLVIWVGHRIAKKSHTFAVPWRSKIYIG